MMARLAWYARRIRVMSLREIAHRLVERARLWQMQRSYERGDFTRIRHRPAEHPFCASESHCLPELEFDMDFNEAAVTRLLQGHWPALGFDWQWRTGRDCWHTAPDTGRTWPAGFFGAIYYLAGNDTGDVRVCWEPSRLQQLIDLALVARLRHGSEAERAIAMIQDQLVSWVEHNPPFEGVHYISAMECAQRLMAACHALDMIRSHLTDRSEVWQSLLSMVTSHAHVIENRLSLHSSTGNHTITEAAGLVYAGALFPGLDGAARWLETGMALLEREAVNQVLADGGGVEQGFRYLGLVVDLFGLVERLCGHVGIACPAAVGDAFARGRGFLSAFADTPEDMPPVGDSDSGFALSHRLRISWPDSIAAEAPLVRTFAESGYTLIRHDEPVAVRLVFDHGDLGLPPSFGHGHADALSLLIQVAGRDLLIDPGTFSYTGHPDWRDYFRSTVAHNTVAIDGADQAVPQTSFMWSDPYSAVLEDCEPDTNGAVRMLARHDGYGGRGATHWRAVVWRPEGLLVVRDVITGTGEHQADLHWHLGVPVAASRNGFDLVGQDARITVTGGVVAVFEGDERMPAGWRSPVYGVRHPTPTIRCRHHGPLPARFDTRLALGAVDIDTAIDMQWAERRIR